MVHLELFKSQKAINRTGKHFKSKINGTLFAVVWNDIDGEQMLLNLNDYHVVMRFTEEESFQIAMKILKLEAA